MCACSCLRKCCSTVNIKRRIVVNVTVLVEHSAVSVRCVFVNTQIRHQHHVVADFFLQFAQCHLHDAGWIKCARANFVFH